VKDAKKCVPPKFRQFLAKETTIHLDGEKKIKAMLFESIDLALRMEAAFCLERLFGLKNKHWYDLKFQDLRKELFNRAP